MNYEHDFNDKINNKIPSISPIICDPTDPVIKSCIKGDLPQLIKILSITPYLKYAVTKHNMSLLHWACIKGHLDIVKFLIDIGISVNIRNNGECTPLDEACWFGHLDIVIHLLDKGADINAKNNQGNSPIFNAVRKNNVDIVKYLVSLGAMFNVPNKYQVTTLMMARINKHEEIIRILELESHKLLK